MLGSQTFDNLDRSKSRGGKSQRREEKQREDQRRERIRRKKIQLPEKVEKSRISAFLLWFVALEGRKVGSLKRHNKYPVIIDRWVSGCPHGQGDFVPTVPTAPYPPCAPYTPYPVPTAHTVPYPPYRPNRIPNVPHPSPYDINPCKNVFESETPAGLNQVIQLPEKWKGSCKFGVSFPRRSLHTEHSIIFAAFTASLGAPQTVKARARRRGCLWPVLTCKQKTAFLIAGEMLASAPLLLVAGSGFGCQGHSCTDSEEGAANGGLTQGANQSESHGHTVETSDNRHNTNGVIHEVLAVGNWSHGGRGGAEDAGINASKQCWCPSCNTSSTWTPLQPAQTAAQLPLPLPPGEEQKQWSLNES